MELVYKYLPPERISYFYNELLRITQPSALNDTFECFPIFPSVEDTILKFQQILKEKTKEINLSSLSQSEKNRRLSLVKKNISQEISKLEKGELSFRDFANSRTMDNVNKTFGVFSLSRNWDSNLMWSHYGESNKGFAIGFNKNHPFFNQGELNIRSVNYSNKRIKFDIDNPSKINIDVLYTKSQEWSYEKEERYIELFENCDEKINAKPFDIYLLKIPYDAIEEIILGLNINDETTEIIKSFTKRNNIKLFKCKMSETEFSLDRSEI